MLFYWESVIVMITQCSWTPLSVSTPQHRPQRLQLHGQLKTLFWRAAAPLVVDDACSHRGASLSLGHVTPDGCIACGYHGKTTRGNPRRTRDVDGIVWHSDSIRGLGYSQALGIHGPIPAHLQVHGLVSTDQPPADGREHTRLLAPVVRPRLQRRRGCPGGRHRRGREQGAVHIRDVS
jgi:hypothetical protein